MLSPFMNVAIARAAQRLPGLRRVPLARLVVVVELTILAKGHLERLTPAERRRLVVLIKHTRGLPRNLSDRERRELERLIAKVEPQAFASRAVERFSPLAAGRKPR